MSAAPKRRRRKPDKRYRPQRRPRIIAGERVEFDESVRFEDTEPPFAGWNPSPRQIREWSRRIRQENDKAAGGVREDHTR